MNIDPIETTITFDHSFKQVMGWTNDRTVMKVWRKYYPENIIDNENNVELRCSMDMIIKPKMLKPKIKRELSEERKLLNAERLRKARESKINSAVCKSNK